MKRVLSGATYDTATAKLVARYRYDDKGEDVCVGVYVTPGGAFFTVNTWDDEDGDDVRFLALTRSGLDSLIASADNFEILDSSVITEPPEAVAEEEPTATLYLRIPPSLKKRHEVAADWAGLSANAWGRMCIEAFAGNKVRVVPKRRSSGRIELMSRPRDELKALGWDELNDEERTDLLGGFLGRLPDRGSGFVEFVRTKMGKGDAAAAD